MSERFTYYASRITFHGSFDSDSALPIHQNLSPPGFDYRLTVENLELSLALGIYFSPDHSTGQLQFGIRSSGLKTGFPIF